MVQIGGRLAQRQQRGGQLLGHGLLGRPGAFFGGLGANGGSFFMGLRDDVLGFGVGFGDLPACLRSQVVEIQGHGLFVVRRIGESDDRGHIRFVRLGGQRGFSRSGARHPLGQSGDLPPGFLDVA